MKIAFFVDQFPTLSETFILNQITGLIDRGHEVDIYADRPGDSEKQHPDVEKYRLLERTCYIGRPDNYLWRFVKGCQLLLANFGKAPIILLRSLNIFKYGKPAATLALFFAVEQLLNQQQVYDIIHCHFGPNGLKAILLKDIGVIQGKLITKFYGYDISEYIQKYGSKVYEKLFLKGEICCAISQYMKCQLIELGCDEKKIAIHRLGVDCSKFSFTPRQQQKDAIVRILTIARLVEKKGVEYGIRAVAKIIKYGINIEYNIVGDGFLREDLQKLIQELDVTDRVNLLGWKQQQEVVEILNKSHILLAPSVTSKKGDEEGTPTVLMEAIAMGLPVVSTYHSGIPEVIQDGISGFLVPERDVDTLAEKLSYLVENPEIWSSMGLAGRAFVEEHYDINKLNDRLVEIYQSLIQLDHKNKIHLTASTQI